MTLKDATMTAEAFFAYAELPENALRNLELHDGVILDMPSPSQLHGLVAAQTLFVFMLFVRDHPIGFVFGDSNDYVLAPGLIYKPDVSFIARHRLPKLVKHFRGAPDIAVEVISPGKTAAEMVEKVEKYLRYGSRLVILMYPEHKTVRVHRMQADGAVLVRTLSGDDWLDGEEVLPGFRVQVRTLFPDLPVEEG
ncbi:MAG: Uma2 family endonuclease [Anaerolineae bacterium]|nr:Uma2 family endonuclease [Anaerolineae bacterium]